MTARARNVLHIVDSLGLGGTQTILKDYLEAHASDRSLHLYGLRTVAKPTRIEHPNVGVHPLPHRLSLAPLRALRTLVQERDISVLHCHLFRAQVFGYLLKRLYFPNVVLIFHEHGRAVGREGESSLEALAFRLFLRLAWRRVDHFICISDLTRTRLLQLIPAAAPVTTVVTNPIPVSPRRDQAIDRAAARREAGVPEGAFVVGFASRLVERKGWDDFLGAMATLAPRLPVHFLMAGDGEDRAKAESRVRELGIGERGRMLGHIDWMRRFYTILDCFVMPSHWEPHGLAQLEAQSFRVPVVVSRVPGLSATVHADKDALLFEPSDVSALAGCVERLASDPALRERLAAGGLTNSGRYSMEAFTASLEAIYASLDEARADAVAQPAR